MSYNNVINIDSRNEKKTFNAQVKSCVGPYYEGDKEYYAVELVSENSQIINAYISNMNYDDVLMEESNYITVSGQWEKLQGARIFEIKQIKPYLQYIEDEQAVVNRIFMFAPININGIYQLTNDVSKFSKKQREFINHLRRAQ